jgi:hypothetical protein
MGFLKSLTRPPSAKEIAARELAQAERLLLAHEAKADYYNKMVEYSKTTINRLRKRVAEENGNV